MVSASVPSQSNINPWILIERDRKRREPSDAEGRQPFLQVVGHQRFEQRVKLAVDDTGKVVKREFNSVVRDAVLREVIGANALVASTGADLRFALRGILRVFLGDSLFQQSRAQHGQRALLVLLLGPIV